MTLTGPVRIQGTDFSGIRMGNTPSDCVGATQISTDPTIIDLTSADVLPDLRIAWDKVPPCLVSLGPPICPKQEFTG